MQGHIITDSVGERTCGFAWEDVRRILARHDFARAHTATTPWEGLRLANADMGALIFGPAYRLCFRLGKMDLWDARMNAEHLAPVLPLSRFKEFIFAESQKLEHGQVVPMDLNQDWTDGGALYPCMRTGADILVRVCRHEQSYAAPMRQQVRLEDGLYEAAFPLGWWPGGAEVTLRAFISWQQNVLALKLLIPRAFHRTTVVSLWRDPWGGRSWELLSSGPSLNGAGHRSWRRDPSVDALPPCTMTAEGSTALLQQLIPGDAFSLERGFSVAATCAEGAEFFLEPSGHMAVEALHRDEVTLFIAMASEMEAPDAATRARALSREAARRGWDALYTEHADGWQRYWMRAMVELDDHAVERKWIRGAYNLAMTARAGRPAPGLVGPFAPNDCPPWRGDRHNNYPEYSSYFWGAFAGNREEQALNFPEFVTGYLPTARRIAAEVFEMERGVAFPMTYVDGTSRYYFHPTWGRSLWVTAVHAQNCWWQYQYFGDREYLARQAYPIMRECARFYCELIEKNPPGDYTLWPTIATEIRGWTKDFALNKNCIEDISHVKFLLRAVIEASSLLDIDGEERRAWQELLDHLPVYPTLTVDGKPEFVDFAGQDQRPAYNHSVPLSPLWPAEDPDVIRDPYWREVAMNTLPVHPWDETRLLIACQRLGMKERVYERLLGKVPEAKDEIDALWTSGIPVVVNEMLVTAWDGIMRIFPCWPLDTPARFHNLRTKGAFLVSAGCAGGDIVSCTIHSERGNPIRLHAPWPDMTIRCLTNGTPVAGARGGDIVQWDTSPGFTYELAPASRQGTAPSVSNTS